MESLAHKRIEHVQLRVADDKRIRKQPLHLEQTHLPRHCLAVADARLGRTHCKWHRAALDAMHRCERACLRRIAQTRARAVSFHAADLRSGCCRAAKRHNQQRTLRRAVGCREARTPAVLTHGTASQQRTCRCIDTWKEDECANAL